MSARSRKIVVETALTVGALAGVLCVVVAIVSVAFGLSPLVVRSGSMTPTIATGDIAVARSVAATDVRVGDIVSVTRPDGTRVTHRVTTIDARVGNSTTMTLRGDANPVADAEPYTVTSVDRVAFHIPKAGYVLTWFATPWVWALATMAVLGLLWVAFRPDRLWHARRHGRHAKVSRTADRRSIAVQVIAVAVVVASALTGYARTSGTFAALTDTATATGSVSAIRPTAPASLSCTTVGTLVTSARLSWPNPVASQGYDYQLVFTPRLLGTSRTVTVPASTTDPTTLNVTSSYVTTILGLSVLGTYDVELRSKVGNFTSSGRLTIALGVVLGSVSCGASTGTSSAAAAPPAARQTAPTSSASTTPSTSTTSSVPPSSMTTAPTTTTSPSSTPPATTTTTPPAIPAGVPSPDGSYVALVSDGVVVIRTAAGVEEYRGSGTSATWIGPSTLRVIASDGTTTDLVRSGGQWTAVSAAASDTSSATTTTDVVG
ncbi:signal peptidase I [uncultured Williamsia sp.]|uniref:signal peptidase I n=1 Tax=uncultured Williamsia sp. TaxID=259311 RepID=UPI00262154ED|nr:signal peptidase I [uncultured Williamsia sp.]